MRQSGLEGRIALVTGGSGGIGKAISLTLAATGAAVAVLGRDPLKGKEIERQIRNSGGTAVFYQADIGKPDTVESAISQIQARLGSVDILVNNAAVSGFMGPVVKTPLTELEKVLRVNLVGVFHLSSLVLPRMMENRFGRIINISSVAYKKNSPHTATYNMSKAALNTFTKTLSKEVASYGITVNAVAPGLVLTDRIKSSRLPFMAEQEGLSQDELLRRLENETDTKRLSREMDVAALVNFLSSSGAQNITGSIVDVAGGF